MNENTMYKLSYGLFVLTARDGEKDNGCIINTAGQVTSTPNRISIAVNKGNFTTDMILKTNQFNLSILSEEAEFELVKRFGFQSGRDANKFAGYTHMERSENGVYYVKEGTNGFISGNVIQTIDVGTHMLFIADVMDMEILSDCPSATYAYYHANIKPKPENKKTENREDSEKKTVWRCKICGYEYVGEELPKDYICPICKHPASDFEKVE